MENVKVEKQEAVNFGRVWHHNGIAIMLSDVHHQFATDFANVVLGNFIRMCKEQAAAAEKAAQKSVILEG